MASVRTSGGTTEVKMEKLLRLRGIRGYRKQWPVAGKPDFAWPKSRVALFVDGCFWHGCPRCDRPSKSNTSFWKPKIISIGGEITSQPKTAERWMDCPACVGMQDR